MKIFTKGKMTGRLELVYIDHVTSNRKWVKRQVLMLMSTEGGQLSSAQFRSNAFKKAENYFVSNGWVVNNQHQLTEGLEK